MRMRNVKATVCLLVSSFAAILGGIAGCGGSSTAGGTSKGGSTTSGPTISSISPTMVAPGGAGFPLTVTGSGFVPGSQIQWNSNSISTIYVSDTNLQSQVPAALIATQGLAGISVLNPESNNAISNTNNAISNTEILSIQPLPPGVAPVSVTGAATVATVNIAANDMVWDPVHQLIYLTALSTDPNYGNSVVALNPSSVQVSSSQFAGSNPDRIAVSSDGSYLYAAIDGSASVQRFALPALSMDINIPLGADAFLGPYYALDLQTAPGLPHTIAVSLGNTRAFSI